MQQKFSGGKNMKIFIDTDGKTYAVINGEKVSQYVAEQIYRKENGIAEETFNYGSPETGV